MADNTTRLADRPIPVARPASIALRVAVIIHIVISFPLFVKVKPQPHAGPQKKQRQIYNISR